MLKRRAYRRRSLTVGALFINERLSPIQVAGAVLAIVAIALIAAA
jgi:drug/metabolite transporter (DMT)-like permease